jgi:hypothetical protein
MQVLVDEGEFRRMQAAARQQSLSLAEWVRGTLREALRQTPTGSVERKLECVRAAVRHSFPSADIERMLEEIERGYGVGS